MVQVISFVVDRFGARIKSVWLRVASIIALIVVILGVLFVLVWPTFKGHFISEKLRIRIPGEYFELHKFLNTQGKNERILELPLYSIEGFEYYDWSDEEGVNGYQGLGFNFFGFSQPYLTPDFARWTESTDSLYVELESAIGAKDAQALRRVLDKYQVDYILTDESKTNSYSVESSRSYGELLPSVGVSLVWEDNNLKLFHVNDFYDRLNKSGLMVKDKLTISSTELDRVAVDYMYALEGDYVTGTGELGVVYPFSYLMREQVNLSDVGDEYVTFDQNIAESDYDLIIPERL